MYLHLLRYEHILQIHIKIDLSTEVFLHMI